MSLLWPEYSPRDENGKWPGTDDQKTEDRETEDQHTKDLRPET